MSSSTLVSNSQLLLSRFEYQDVVSAVPPNDSADDVALPQQEEGNPAAPDPELMRRIQEARQEGIAEGLRQAAKQYDDQLAVSQKQIAKTINDFGAERAEYYRGVERELVRLGLSIAARILHREAQVDPLLLAGLVKVALSHLDHSTPVKINTRPEESAMWTNSLGRVLDPSLQVEYVTDSTLNPGDCRLETEVGSVDVGIGAQLKEIELGLMDILKQRPVR